MNALTSSESTSAASAPTKRARPSVSPRGSPFPLSQSQCHLIDRNQRKKVSTVMYAKLFPQVPERANPWQRQALHCVSRAPLTLLLLLPRRGVRALALPRSARPPSSGLRRPLENDLMCALKRTRRTRSRDWGAGRSRWPLWLGVRVRFGLAFEGRPRVAQNADGSLTRDTLGRQGSSRVAAPAVTLQKSMVIYSSYQIYC